MNKLIWNVKYRHKSTANEKQLAAVVFQDKQVQKVHNLKRFTDPYLLLCFHRYSNGWFVVFICLKSIIQHVQVEISHCSKLKQQCENRHGRISNDQICDRRRYNYTGKSDCKGLLKIIKFYWFATDMLIFLYFKS